MSLFFLLVRTHRRRVATLSLAYVVLASTYLLLVSHEYGVWQTKRQQLINESPVVWVAPYGIRYHQEKHYSRHLSSPISLYEATEREYEYCEICHPPRPAQLLQSPFWVRHWIVILLVSSCLWLILSLIVLHRMRMTL